VKAKIKVGAFDVELDGTPSELATVLTALQTAPTTPPVFVPTFQLLDPCPMGGAHEYPEWWLSVSPPHCTKCGSLSPNWYTFQVDQQVTNPMPPCRTTVTRIGFQQEVPAELLEGLQGLPGYSG
jgi:hypothetical protein